MEADRLIAPSRRICPVQLKPQCVTKHQPPPLGRAYRSGLDVVNDPGLGEAIKLQTLILDEKKKKDLGRI